MSRALLIIDIQRDYFPGGAFPLVDPDQAAAAARVVLDKFRAADEPVIHVQHLSSEPDASFMVPGTAGVQIHPLVAPVEGEPVITKAFPNSFRETNLDAVLEAGGIDSLVVAGMMTSMCVDATVRAAADRGLDVVVVSDACAAPDLKFHDRAVAGADVHAAFLAALDGTYGEMVTSDSFTV